MNTKENSYKREFVTFAEKNCELLKRRFYFELCFSRSTTLNVQEIFAACK